MTCPPLEGERTADVVVIGAGYAGLNCAMQLAREHQREVVVLDAQWPGWGASGRNGGFCCIGGGKLSYTAVAKRWGQAATKSYAQTQRNAVNYVEQLLEQEGIDASISGRGELCLAHSRRAAAGFAAEAKELGDLHGVELQHWSAAQVRERGAVAQGCSEGLYNPIGFGLNPGRYVTGLAEKCVQAGVTLLGKSAALGVKPEQGRWRISTANGSVLAQKLVITTNGYSSDNLPQWLAGRYLPILSSIIVTRPLRDSEYAEQGFSCHTMTYDSRSLLHYFRRLPDGRFMFGTRGGLKASEAASLRVRARAQRDFARMFPAWVGVEQTHFWSGLVCMTSTLQPFVGPIPECANAYAAFGWHGNGVAMASHGGHLLADIVAGKT